MKGKLVRILAGAALFACALLIQPVPAPVTLVLYAAAYLTVGASVLYKALRNILRGRIFDENFLMAVASLGAFFIAEYPEAVAVMIFYQVGELFESYAVSRSRRSIASLMEIRPDHANVRRDGILQTVAPEEVAVGEEIVVRPGEKIPLDGLVMEGSSALDSSALTGESLPRDVVPGEEVLSGCVNLSSVLTVRVERAFHDSTVSRILDLVENAAGKKSASENFISRFAAVYTPIVVAAAVILAVVPSLITGQWTTWLYRALNFLVVSCPCALVISVPLSFFGGIGGASRAGVLVKGGNYLEALASTEIVVFDKTGTLTEGVFEVSAINPVGIEAEELLYLAAAAEHFSSHPISQSIQKAYGAQIDESTLHDVREIPGQGVEAHLNGAQVCAGNDKLMQTLGLCVSTVSGAGTVVHLARDGVYCGHILISDRIKPDAEQAVRQLRRCGVKKLYMLSGDRRETAEAVSKTLRLDGVYAELLPTDKVEALEQLEGQVSAHGKLAFVGDGINDAPVLARADIGVAMGALGSDAAIESADVVIMNDKPSRLAAAIGIARHTLRIVRENIVLALAVKAAVLVLCAIGAVGMWAAVFADVGVMFLAVLNALRALRAVEK